ncbi:MAG: phosphoglycerate kinase [Candidatus Freyarchaeota archaeon]|nr:phosphoglycerate kinase [Candidatus Jordarchaeia archaeon]
MGKEFFTLDDFFFDGKTVLVRVDINSPIDPETGSLKEITKIKRHGETLLELAEKGARVVALSHQGREGESDFVPLKQHAKTASELLGVNIGYVDDVCGDKAVSAIKRLKPSEILLLENVRFVSEETKVKSLKEQLKTNLVRNLSTVSDIFVNDAFPAAHRSHVSLIAFTEVMPSAAGRVMEAEVKALSSIMNDPERPCVYLLGGSKIDDSFRVAENALKTGIADKVLVTGLLAVAFVAARGVDVGEVNKRLIISKGASEYIEQTRKLMDAFGDKIKLPLDFALEINGERVEAEVGSLPHNAQIKDLGEQTISEFAGILRKAKTIVINGPAGVYEDDRFSKGTEVLLKAIAETQAFSLAGGGHTLEALEKFGVSSKISYVSTGGKAMLSLLAGEKLPAVEALKKAYLRAVSEGKGE